MTNQSTRKRPGRRTIGLALLSGMAALLSAVPAHGQEEMDREDREYLQRIEREVREQRSGEALAAVSPIPLPSNEYAVKFVCGRMGNGFLPPVINGFYATAVNVHNPGPPIKFARKVAIAPPGKPGGISGFWVTGLKNDQAIEFDCRQIYEQAFAAGLQPGPFIKGFLVIRSQRQLDVVAVYTAGPSNGQGVSSIHTERVPPRRVP